MKTHTSAEVKANSSGLAALDYALPLATADINLAHVVRDAGIVVQHV